ncbi:hypothetical protein EPO05_02725 [Patescibacteria group bacterium]|nr:MAG: hypothetical protein EPO05_02725 [Patescibacteria group bacterium]
MQAKELYTKLDADFQISQRKDDWEGIDLGDFIHPEFLQKYMGLVLDNSTQIEKVFTAVFPSEAVLSKILDSGEQNVLLFTHHPRIWDIKLAGYPFKDITSQRLQQLKDNHVSLYTLHVPLDKNGPYGTSVNLAKALGVSQESEFCDYFGVKVGVIGRISLTTIDELAKKCESVLGHAVKAHLYGDSTIKDGRVAVVAGGGNMPEIITELHSLGINTYVTGVTRQVEAYQPSVDFHRLAQEHRINVLGGTHYSTEKFACLAMVEYFQKLGLPTEFLPDESDPADL